MNANYKRSIIFHTNKYQRKIILLSVVPSMVAFIFVLCFLSVFFKMLNHSILSGTTEINLALVTQGTVFIFLFFFVFIAGSIGWIFLASNRLVGAFVRVLHEMDEVIEGKKTTVITAREKDGLVNDLLERVNAIIVKSHTR